MVAKVVPESCQRTEGIFAWLEMKDEKERKQFEKEQRRREKEEQLQIETEQRNFRNEERPRENEMKKREKLMKKNIENNNDRFEKETMLNLNQQIETKKVTKSVHDICSACKSNKAGCKCKQRKSEVSAMVVGYFL